MFAKCQVKVAVVHSLLRMVGGMQHILLNNIIESKDQERRSSQLIHQLQIQLVSEYVYICQKKKFIMGFIIYFFYHFRLLCDIGFIVGATKRRGRPTIGGIH